MASVGSRTAPDLWAELNRTRVSAAHASDAFAGLATALKDPLRSNVVGARNAVQDACLNARLEDLAHQISSMAKAERDCDLGHDRLAKTRSRSSIWDSSRSRAIGCGPSWNSRST
jgi:hypothetical protein